MVNEYPSFWLDLSGKIGPPHCGRDPGRLSFGGKFELLHGVLMEGEFSSSG